MEELSQVLRERLIKAEEMEREGICLYPNGYRVDDAIGPIVNDYSHKSKEELEAESPSFLVAGRILALRSFGRSIFMHIQDGSGKIQIYCQQNTLSKDTFALVKKFDLGDIIRVQGTLFRTKTNELTLLAQDVVLLTKNLRPLPEKYHGLKDVETRYRQRYVDLIVNDHVRETFRRRSQIVSEMRQVLTELGYFEVETPMMHPICGGANARPFKTHHNALGVDLCLRIAPELYLKRLMVGGFEKIFEINRNFRNEGISTKHNPEFTMLELYTAYWDYRDTMDLTERTIREVAQRVFGSTRFTFDDIEFDLGPPFPRLTYLEAIQRFVPGASNLDLRWDDPPEVTKAKIAPFFTPEFDGPTFQMIIDMFETLVEPQLRGPIFITEFAKAVSPLAKSKPSDPLVAERFELYIAGMEIANGYSELNDPQEQYQRFREQMEARERGDDEAHQMDEDYIRALEYGMPPASGLGIGIDRLVMVLTNSPSIRDVVLFPLLKPEKHEADVEIRESPMRAEESPQ